MSLINDALKTAQRAKQARESGTRPAPILMPLRSKPRPTFSWMRSLLLGGTLAVVAGVGWLAVQRVKNETLRPLQAPPPILLGDTSRPVLSDTATRPVPSARVEPKQPTQVAVVLPPRRSARTRARPTTSAPPASRAAAASAGEPRLQASSGGLRVAVEQPRDPDAAELFVLAVTAHRAGDLASARSLYERVLLMSPADVDAMNNLGILLSSTRDFERAELLLRRAALLSPRNANVWSNLGTVLRDRGQVNDAIAAFQHALSIEPKHQGARISLAQEYVANSAFPEARAILDEIVATNPASPEAQYALGQVLEQQGDVAGAVRAYSAFVRIAPARFAADQERVRRRIQALVSR